MYTYFMVDVELRPHGIAPMNATSLFMVFWSSMLFPDSGGDAPVPSSMLFPDSGFEIAEEPLGRNPAWAQFQWNLIVHIIPICLSCIRCFLFCPSWSTGTRSQV